ncbi:hypothetical protein ACFWXA_35085 [Streptomyces atroolivaceus]|uniref:hypothetical protein n=1 Tax=Streptomyces atroolivaceus TaxID=66869 RepID=UPI003664ACA4
MVPDTALASRENGLLPPNYGQARRQQPADGPSKQLRVREMLSYLGVALPVHIGATARLIALQCTLRSTPQGYVRIPGGLLRGMRLDDAAYARQDLEDAGWLHVFPRWPQARQQDLTAQLLDATVWSQAPGRLARARAADWALRVCSTPQLRGLEVTPRLLGLTLTAYAEGENPRTCIEAEALTRTCALDATDHSRVLDLLLCTGFLSSWSCDPHTGDLEWSN